MFEYLTEEQRNDLKSLLISLKEAGKDFGKAYENGGEDLDKYLEKSSKKWEQKGMNEKDAREKAREMYEKRASNIYKHSDHTDKPFTDHKFPAQTKKY